MRERESVFVCSCSSSSNKFSLHICRRPMTRPDDKPVASVRPIQSTPIPMMPRQVGMGMVGSGSSGSLPVNFLQKAGVYVQRIVTTTGYYDVFNV